MTDLKKIKCGKIKENVDLSLYTTYKVKATGKYMVFPSNIEELICLMNFIKSKKLLVVVLI